MARGWIATCALAAACLAVPSAQQPATVFRADADLTHVAVTVTDRRGTPVTTLSADDFEILEDGQLQTIRYFARGSEDSAPDLYAGIMLDSSESMIKDRSMSHGAAIKFLNRLPEARELTLVDFDTEIRIGRFSQDNFPRLVERIRSRQESGWTALYDAFVVYLGGAWTNPGRSVLVAVTDGGNSRSSASYTDVLSAVRASTNVTIYVVGLVENQSPDVRSESRVRLSRIAEESGGEAIFPYSMKQVEEAYDRIVAGIHGQYSIGYVSSNRSRNGAWRSLKVRLRGPRSKDLRIRSREGYFAPAAR
jgi:VWFA-related protein